MLCVDGSFLMYLIHPLLFNQQLLFEYLVKIVVFDLILASVNWCVLVFGLIALDIDFFLARRLLLLFGGGQQKSISPNLRTYNISILLALSVSALLYIFLLDPRGLFLINNWDLPRRGWVMLKNRLYRSANYWLATQLLMDIGVRCSSHHHGSPMFFPDRLRSTRG